MYRWAGWGAVMLGLVILAAPALGWGAAAPQAGTPVLDLKQLTEMALKFSPDVKASESEVKLAKEHKNEVHGYLFPQFDATATTGVIPNARLPIIPAGGYAKRLYYPDPKSSIHGVNIFGRLDFSVVQPLYTFGKIKYRERATEKNVKVKKEGVVAKQGEVILLVSQAYYGLILANQGKEAVKEARSYLNDTKERINRLIATRSPNVRETDKYRLAAYEGAIEKSGAEAEEGAKTAYKALKALTGMVDRDFQVPVDLPTPAAPAGGLDNHIRTALDMRPEFRQLKAGLVARQLLVDAAKADRLPSFFFAVIGQLAGAPGRSYNPDPYIIDYFNDNGALPMVGAKWHFDFGILNAKVGQAKAELEQLQNQEKTALMGIPVEVAKNYGEVQQNYKASVGMEKAYVNARRWLVTTFSNFDMGLGSISDIFQAFERYGVFRGDYLMALYHYNVSVTQLDKTTGAFRKNLPAAKIVKAPFKPLPFLNTEDEGAAVKPVSSQTKTAK